MTPLLLPGLVAAPHTPMDDHGEIRHGAVRQQVDVLVESRVAAAFVCGTTGEGPSLSTDERMRVAAEWCRLAPPTLPVIVHVGHASLAEARALAAHAQSAGAAAVSALAPFFFRPAGVTELIEYCRHVAAAAPGLPFYYYHLPSMTGFNCSVVEFLGRARGAIPTFAGVKYTHNDLHEFQQLVALAGDSLDVLFGRDELLLAGLAVGARGAIGSTYNYAAPVYHRMIAAFAAGDVATARDCQARAGKLIDAIRAYGEIPAAKAIMEMIGVPCGPPRLPLVALTAERRAALRRDLAGLDIFVRPLATVRPE
jgi:N-acetylneuraminate lyase